MLQSLCLIRFWASHRIVGQTPCSVQSKDEKVKKGNLVCIFFKIFWNTQNTSYKVLFFNLIAHIINTINNGSIRIFSCYIIASNVKFFFFFRSLSHWVISLSHRLNPHFRKAVEIHISTLITVMFLSTISSESSVSIQCLLEAL